MITRRLFALFCGSALTTVFAQDAKALAAAEKWLTLADEGKLQDCYKAAGKTFRAQMTYEEWEPQMEKIRTAEGAFQSRKLVDQKSTKTLAGSPDGEYVVIHFNAVFANKPAAKETIVMSKEGGVWKFAGYVIH